MTRFSYLEFLQAANGFREKFGRALKSFDIERKVIQNRRHGNLVKIISTCLNDDFKALILEYMSNGNWKSICIQAIIF